MGLFEPLADIGKMRAEAEAAKRWEEYLAELEAIGLPEYERQALEQLGPSALEGVRPDAQSVAAQRAALERLRTLSEGGPDAQYDAQMNEALSRANQNEARTRAGIVDRAASMGGLGGGQALALQMAAQQSGAQQAQRASLDAAAEQQRRAYQALRDSGSMAGQMRGQQWGEDAQRAQAADAIARQNLALRQQRTQYNNDLAGRGYDDQLRKTGMKSGVYQQQNQTARNQAQINADAAKQYDEDLKSAGNYATGGFGKGGG